MLLLNSCRFCIYFVFIHRFLLNCGFVKTFIFNVEGSMSAMIAEEPQKFSGRLLFFFLFFFKPVLPFYLFIFFTYFLYIYIYITLCVLIYSGMSDHPYIAFGF